MLCHHAQYRGESPDPQRSMCRHYHPLMTWFAGLQNDVTADLVNDRVTPSAAQVSSEVISVEIAR